MFSGMWTAVKLSGTVTVRVVIESAWSSFRNFVVVVFASIDVDCGEIVWNRESSGCG